MVLSIVGVKEFLLHHVDALDLSSCSFPLQRSAISVLLQSVRRRRPQAVTRPWWPWRRQKTFEAFGGRATSKPPLACTTPNNEIQDANSNLGISKVFWNPCLGHDTIWRPGQEMKVYVDKENM